MKTFGKIMNGFILKNSFIMRGNFLQNEEDFSFLYDRKFRGNYEETIKS